MTYLRYCPSPPLDRYIHHLYYMDGRMPFLRERILPAPLLDLKINLGSAFHVFGHCPIEQSQRLIESWLVGLYGEYHSIEWPTDMRLYGVRFKPTGVYPFLSMPLSELYNQVVALNDVWGRFASELRERLYAVSSVREGFRLFERLLRRYLCEKPSEQDIVEYGIAEISRHHGSLSIKALSDHIGISQNHLRTQFKQVVGTSAKEMARIYRFEHVLRSIDPIASVNWTRIAQQCSYFDQSHLNKDFVALTGYNPTGFLNQRRRVYAQVALVDQLSLRNLPTD